MKTTYGRWLEDFDSFYSYEVQSASETEAYHRAKRSEKYCGSVREIWNSINYIMP